MSESSPTNPGWTQMELAGLYRRLKAEGDGYDQTVNGWGVSFSGSIDTYGNDSFVWGVEYGEALGAYIQDTLRLGPGCGAGIRCQFGFEGHTGLRPVGRLSALVEQGVAVIGHLWVGESLIVISISFPLPPARAPISEPIMPP